MFSALSLWNYITLFGGAGLAVLTYATPLIPPPYNLAVSGGVTLLSGLLHLNATPPGAKSVTGQKGSASLWLLIILALFIAGCAELTSLACDFSTNSGNPLCASPTQVSTPTPPAG
jgi:hypothetical protein